MASISSSLSLLLCYFIAAVVFATVSAEEFQVGGVVGWRIPATNETKLYNVWASRRRFHVGDTLRFRYKNNSVAVVEKWGFYHCDSSNPIAFFNDGDTVIDLDNMGTMYFISGDSDRCKDGVSMMVDVMSPAPVIHFPPAISSPPENAYSGIAPAPAPTQLLSSGDSTESIPGSGSSSSESSTSFSILVSVTTLVAGALGF